MTNPSNSRENQKIVVKDPSGDSKEIDFKDDLTSLLKELKVLLEQSKSKEFQIADKIYNIEKIDEANFGFLVGDTTFNETLTRSLVNALRPHNKKAEIIAEKMADIGSSETDRIQDFLAKIFVGVIGGQLRTLFAIGKEAATESDPRNYIKKCLFITKRCFDLINFALLSELWEAMKKKDISLSKEQRKVLSGRFESEFEYTIPDQFELLKTLHGIFSKNELSFPIPEMGFDKEHKQILAAQMHDQSDLHKVCSGLQKLAKKDRAKYDILDSYEAETQLASLLGHFYFLIHYNMVSIKRIDYRQIRNLDPFYLHNYASLGSVENATKINYTSDAVHTHAVLLYRGDNYKNSINLFPFVIDYNALSLEEGTTTYFFKAKAFDDESLAYICLEKDDTKEIKSKGVEKNSNMNELLIDKKNRISFNLDCVANQFKAAKDCILGTGTENIDQ